MARDFKAASAEGGGSVRPGGFPAGGEPSLLEQRTMRHVLLRIVPLLILCYFANYLDRVNVSFAALQMNQDLHFNASTYGFGAGSQESTHFCLQRQGIIIG